MKTFFGFCLMMGWFFFVAVVLTGCAAALGMPKETDVLLYLLWVVIGGYGGGFIACSETFEKWWDAL